MQPPFAKVSSSIFDAESGISSCNFLYLLNIRNLSTRQLKKISKDYGSNHY